MRGEIRTLTGLRGLAAVLVMLYHFTRDTVVPNQYTPNFIKSGYLAVDIFFILSGFVITLRYEQLFKNKSSFLSFFHFLFKRFARIYPAYIVVTLYAIAVMLLKHDVTKLSDFGTATYIANLFMANGWGLNFTPIVGDSWSVSAEILAYLCFPILIHLATRPRPYALPLFFFCSIVGIVIVNFSGLGIKGSLDVTEPDSFMPVLRCIAGFCIGIACFKFSHNAPVHRILSADTALPVIIVLYILFTTFHLNDIIVYALFPPLVVSTYYGGALAKSLFSSPLAHNIGVVSYSLYLVHPFVQGSARVLAPHLSAVIGPLGAPLTVAIASIVTCLIANISYRAIERPGQKMLESRVRMTPSSAVRTA